MNAPGALRSAGGGPGNRLGPGFALRPGTGALAAGTLLACAGLLVAAPAHARMLVPAAVLVAAALLLSRDITAYAAFVAAVWLLAPLARRYCDAEAGSFSALSPLIAAPVIALLPAGALALRHAPLLLLPAFRPFALVACGIGIATATAIARGDAAAGLYAAAGYAGALGFGIAIASNWRDYDAMVAALARWLPLAVIGVGVYGCVQYVAIAPWDAFWMRHVPMNSIGAPEPFAVRVFATLNAPNPFAIWMMSALLLLAVRRPTPLVAIALCAGLAAFALALVRSAWGGLAVGLAALVVLRAMPLYRLAALVAGGALLLLVAGEDGVMRRLAGIGALGADHSLGERLAFHRDIIAEALSRPFGAGLGATGQASRLTTDDGELGRLGDFDSGILALLYECGWAGGLPILAGLLALTGSVLRRSVDATSAAAAAAVLALVLQLPFFAALSGLGGVIAFGCAGFVLAGQRHHAARFAP